MFKMVALQIKYLDLSGRSVQLKGVYVSPIVFTANLSNI